MKSANNISTRTLDVIAPRRSLVTKLLRYVEEAVLPPSVPLLDYSRVCEGEYSELCNMVSKSYSYFLEIKNINKVDEYWKRAHSPRTLEAIRKLHERALQSLPPEIRNGGTIIIENSSFMPTISWNEIYSPQLSKFLISFMLKYFEKYVVVQLNSPKLDIFYLPSLFKKTRYVMVKVDEALPSCIAGVSRKGHNTLRLMYFLSGSLSFEEACSMIFSVPLSLLTSTHHLDKRFFTKVYPNALRILREQANVFGKHKLWKEARELVYTHIRELKKNDKKKPKVYNERELKVILFECFQTGAHQFFEKVREVGEMERSGSLNAATPFHLSNLISNVAPGVLGHLVEVR